MRIGIDARYLSHGIVGGVHTHILLLVSALAKYEPDHQYFLYIDKKREFEISPLPSNVTLRYLPYWGAPSSVLNDLFMKQSMVKDKLDVVHYPANYGFGPSNAATVVTLHDAINILPLRDIIRGHRKNIKTIVMMTYLHFMSTWSIPKADRVITVSEYSRQEILKHSRVDPQKVIAMTNGPSPDLARVTDPQILADVRSRRHLTKPFVLADALKNPAVIVRAWRLLPAEIQSQWQIVYFSRRPDPLPVVKEAVDAGFARLLINPPFADLAALYSMAEIFIFPSWIEGLGLPALEAMTCGAPVIGSDRGSIPEVTGGAALIMDAEDEKTLASYIERLFRSPEEVQRLRQFGFAQVEKFKWEKITHRLIEVYRSIQ